jgi:hypothetical protein
MFLGVLAESGWEHCDWIEVIQLSSLSLHASCPILSAHNDVHRTIQVDLVQTHVGSDRARMSSHLIRNKAPVPPTSGQRSNSASFRKFRASTWLPRRPGRTPHDQAKIQQPRPRLVICCSRSCLQHLSRKFHPMALSKERHLSTISLVVEITRRMAFLRVALCTFSRSTWVQP